MIAHGRAERKRVGKNDSTSVVHVGSEFNDICL